MKTIGDTIPTISDSLTTIARQAGRNAFFHIEPRYTSGSPAMISMLEVLRIAVQEFEAHARCLTGVYGDELKTLAETKGLKYIAYARWEKGSKVWRLDLLTNEIYEEPKQLTWTDRERLIELRGYLIHHKKIGESFRWQTELDALEFRAMIHRETIT